MVTDPASRRVSVRQLAWLEEESRAWSSSGLIDDGAREAILRRYSAESAERRGMTAIVLLAVGMVSVGLLLLIGYNWDQIPRSAKLAIVIGSVAAAFAGSAAAFARGRTGAAETLAFFGALLYGNAIWLVAQVLHIEGRYPDAFLWWAAGCLACAWLVGSAWIGALGSAGVLLWVGAEGDLSTGPALTFLAIWPLALAVAYSLRSSLMIRIAAPSAALWAFLCAMDASHSAFWLGGIAAVGVSMLAVARWHTSDRAIGRAWEASGLVVLLLVFVPLMFTAVHADMSPGRAGVQAVAIFVVAMLVSAAGLLRTSGRPIDTGAFAIAGAVLAWALASWSGWFGPARGFALAATVLFSALALIMAIALVRTALATGRITDLAFGVLFALEFLVVRWVSVIENLLWSGVLLVSAGGGLLLVAKLWRRRGALERSAS